MKLVFLIRFFNIYTAKNIQLKANTTDANLNLSETALNLDFVGIN